jgi:transposase
VLSEFRQRLLAGSAERLLLDKLLERCAAQGLLKGKKKQRTDSTHVLAAIRRLTLLELVGETMRRTLDDVARVAPEWLGARLQPEWIKRYGRRFDSYRLPKGDTKRRDLAIAIGQDGYFLLTAAFGESAPVEVRTLPMIDIMCRIWLQQFYWCDGEVHWRTKKKWGQPSAGKMIASPEDLEAKYRVKRSTEWTGYLVHLTETCQKDQPRLITQVETTAASIHDSKVTTAIHDDLADRELLPETHLVDEGYMETDLLVDSQKRGIDMVGPVPSSKSWQSRAGTPLTRRSLSLTGNRGSDLSWWEKESVLVR